MPLTIRVYGLMLKDNHILLSDETIYGKYYTKLPGGGLELGEGTKDCIRREFMEELNWRVEAGEHLYTTDFYQQSAFDENDQVISIYYLVNPLEEKDIKYTTETNFGELENFRWHPIDQLSEDTMTLPIDKIAIKILLEKLNNN